jgi:class 3 adenylate cyclase
MPPITQERRFPINLSNLFIILFGDPRQFSFERQMLNFVLMFSAASAVTNASENYLLGISGSGIMVAQAVIYLAGYWLVRTKRAPTQLVTAAMIVNFLLISSFAWFYNEGLDGSVTFFFITPVIICFAILRGRLRTFFVFLTLANLVALSFIQISHPELVKPYPSVQVKYLDILYSFGVITVFFLGYITISLYNLNQRRKQADDLLLNILPEPIAEQLKYNPSQTIAQDFSNVSVLFADVVNFTQMSSKMSPTELVSLLDEVFSYFDTLVEKYGLEKIKTIGDCYMVAAGVPQPSSDNAQVITRLALEMRDHVALHDFQGQRLSFRFGINTGSVVAGVIGRHKFSYDLWGDAVNTASRMESHGKANIIQITRSTYELIAGEFQCDAQGSIYVKGKGDMEVWHVIRQASN